MKTKAELITRSNEILSGIPVFAGTRVPVQTLFDYLADGDRLADFLEDFPTVDREQAMAVIELSKAMILAQADASPAR